MGETRKAPAPQKHMASPQKCCSGVREGRAAPVTVEGKGSLGLRVPLLPCTGRTHSSRKWPWAPLEGGRLGSRQREGEG